MHACAQEPRTSRTCTGGELNCSLVPPSTCPNFCLSLPSLPPFLYPLFPFPLSPPPPCLLSLVYSSQVRDYVSNVKCGLCGEPHATRDCPSKASTGGLPGMPAPGAPSMDQVKATPEACFKHVTNREA